MIQGCYHAWIPEKANTLAMTVWLAGRGSTFAKAGGSRAQGSMPLIADVLSEEFFNGNSLLLGVEDDEYFHGRVGSRLF